MSFLTANRELKDNPQSSSVDSVDQRPRFGIGHVNLPVSNASRSADFYTKAGMRLVVNMGRAAIVELRGGTHIIVSESGGAGQGSLDLIVDDIDETHAVLTELGANPTNIRRGHPHDSFSATDPDGNHLSVHSNHAMGPV